eukprot:6578999-Pyramimonas_sp.AAC.2
MGRLLMQIERQSARATGLVGRSKATSHNDAIHHRCSSVLLTFSLIIANRAHLTVILRSVDIKHTRLQENFSRLLG